MRGLVRRSMRSVRMGFMCVMITIAVIVNDERFRCWGTANAIDYSCWIMNGLEIERWLSYSVRRR
jgi:hypothetical protein